MHATDPTTYFTMPKFRRDSCRNVAAAVQPGRTALVMVESPTNPRMQVCDIAALAAIAHDAGAICCVDNR